MNIVSTRPGVNASGKLVLSVDVSEQFLDCYVRLSDSYRRIPNTTPAITAHVSAISQFAVSEHLSGILVACEPSGGYERTLVAAARAAGCHVVHVSAEQVAQLRSWTAYSTTQPSST